MRGRRERHVWAAVVFGAVHLALQLGVYVLAFAVGPGGATHEVLGISLYGIASVLTFPFLSVAERLGSLGQRLGLLVFPLNSATWACGLYLALGLVAHVRRRGTQKA
ncbi:MAG: hypothetical protein ACXWLL_10405 [Myxococcaceae bacterium]